MGNSWSNFWVDYFQTRNCGIVGIPVRRRFWVSEPRSFEKWSASALLPEVGGSMAHGLSIFQRTDDFFNAALVISIVCQRKTKKQRANSRWLFVRFFLDGWSVSYRNLMQISELKCFRWCMYWLGTKCHHTLASLHSTHWVRQVPSFEHSGHLNIHPPPSCKNSTQNPRMASNSNRKSSSSPISIHHFFFEGMMG